MKSTKIVALIMVVVMGLTLFTGCSSRKGNLNAMDMGDIERLPEEQKDAELDKTLAQMRKFRTNNFKVENGSMSSLSQRDDAIPGQTKNRPDFSDAKTEEFWALIHDYVENEAGVPKRKYGYDVSQCMDPRMNIIYDDDDKGVAAGYDNENIYLAEYETAEDGVYSYLVLVRESRESPWQIIHDGLSYKE
ncbi:hypothetical protein E0485_11445 [Paenibacillus albiflavus]|uniref:Uncharacterized protein n=1 Tax=Paenibacillus albiflavus TaxID=2545760 RepID=A0A4R4EB38_9BACL|nr:hypothetical protein [Paenibacillus albiflavus]TCZ77074.1 hypothetical protein E0485_11445 [Paenibacillus albiflavus]